MGVAMEWGIARFTLKFVGLSREDAPTPYYYGSLPAEPRLGHMLVYNETGNRYVIYRIDGKALVGDNDHQSQRELAWADINRDEAVPTLWLQKIEGTEAKPQGRSFTYGEMKEYRLRNREPRLSATKS